MKNQLQKSLRLLGLIFSDDITFNFDRDRGLSHQMEMVKTREKLKAYIESIPEDCKIKITIDGNNFELIISNTNSHFNTLLYHVKIVETLNSFKVERL